MEIAPVNEITLCYCAMLSFYLQELLYVCQQIPLYYFILKIIRKLKFGGFMRLNVR